MNEATTTLAHYCPLCLAVATPSGYLAHAAYCPNGVDALAWEVATVHPNDARVLRAEGGV